MTDLPTRNIIDLNDSDLGKKVKLEGTIEKISSYDNKTTFIKLSQKCSIDITSFDNIKISNNSMIVVEGKYQEYNGQRSVIADKIEKK